MKVGRASPPYPDRGGVGSAGDGDGHLQQRAMDDAQSGIEPTGRGRPSVAADYDLQGRRDYRSSKEVYSTTRMDNCGWWSNTHDDHLLPGGSKVRFVGCTQIGGGVVTEIRYSTSTEKASLGAGTGQQGGGDSTTAM